MDEPKLVRGLGRWDFTAIVINTIIGAGIFGLPAKVYAQIGSWSLLAFVACTLVIGLVVLAHAEVSSRFSATGGPYLYAREAYGPVVAFEVGWLFWIVRVTTFAANCNLFVTYLGFFVPGANEGALRVALISLIVITLTAVNFRGIRHSALMTNVLTAGKLIPLLIFAGVGVFFIEPSNFTFDALPGYSSFSTSVLLLIYAFVGFESAIVLSGEVREPQRSLPFGTLVGLGICAVLYIVVQAVSIGTLPGLAASERPIADASVMFLGVFGAGFVTIGALSSILGNLNISVLASTRTLFAMSEQRQLPSVLSRTHAIYQTPTIAILLTAVVMLVLTVQSSFLGALTIATITRLIIYATTCFALPLFRRRTDLPPPAFKAPFGVTAALLSIALIVWLLSNVDYTKEGRPLIVAGVAGLIVFAVYNFGKRDAVDESKDDNG
jgi:amino acid transporter